MKARPEPDPSSQQLPEGSSRSLLRRAQAGDQRALDQLLERHLRSLTRWARGKLPRWARQMGDTADLVQDTVLKTFRRLGHFEDRGAGALRAYLRQSARNQIRDAVRRVQRRGTDEELPQEVPDLEGSTPLDLAIGAEGAARYRRALARLRSRDQQAITGRMELHYSYDQIALLLGKASPYAARMSVKRALQRLAEEMEKGE
jgi:RNA polymerase sigma-70 factor (ECF subfamily)